MAKIGMGSSCMDSILPVNQRNQRDKVYFYLTKDSKEETWNRVMDPDSAPREIEVSASLLENSCGVALDLGGSVAKIVYRCNKVYKGGKLIDNTQTSPDVGYLKVVCFPLDALDAYVQYIADHADLTGDPPQINSCGIGVDDYKDSIEKKLNVKLNNLSEFNCVASVLLRIINDSALTSPYHDMDPQGLQQGREDFCKHITFQFISDGLPMPERSEFDEVISDAVGKVQDLMKEDIKLPCLIVMCGSGFPLMVLRENGTFECSEIMLMGGCSFLGLASIMTGERDWNKITHLLDTHDGSTAYSYREGSRDSEPQQEGAETTQKMENENCSSSTSKLEGAGSTADGDEDPYSTTRGMKFFPFGNGNVVPRESIKNGDLLYTLFETFSTNIATLAYNTALAQDLQQVLFCGSFVRNPLAQTVITREIMWRNIRAYYRKKFNKLVDFRFIRNGGHLGALGALLNTE